MNVSALFNNEAQDINVRGTIGECFTRVPGKARVKQHCDDAKALRAWTSLPAPFFAST